MKRIAKIKDVTCVAIYKESNDHELRSGEVDVTGMSVGPGYIYNGSVWSGPSEIPTKSAYDLYDSFTSAERIAIRNSGNDMIDDFVDHLDKAINAGVTLDMSDGSKTTVALEGLEAAGLLTEDRVAAIRAP